MTSENHRAMAEKARRLARSVGDQRTKQALEDAAAEYEARASDRSTLPLPVASQQTAEASQQQQQIQPETDSEPPKETS